MARNRKQKTSPVPASPVPRPTLVQRSESFEGPVPHPSLLQQYDQIVPGAANRILEMAEQESRHRQLIESQANEANISAQKSQLTIAADQQKYAFYSDTVGKSLGFITTAGALTGSVFLAINDHTTAAVALASLPLAAIIEAFRQQVFKKL